MYGKSLFKQGESSVKLKVKKKKKNSLQVSYMIAVWDISDTFLIPSLNCPIAPTLFKSWGKLFHKLAQL